MRGKASSMLEDVCVAPNPTARSRLNSTGSTAKMRPAPAETGSLDRGAADASDPDDGHVLTRLYPSPMNGRAPAGTDPTGHQTGPIQRDVLIDLDEGPLVADRVAGKRSRPCRTAAGRPRGRGGGRSCHRPAIRRRCASPCRRGSGGRRCTMGSVRKEAGHDMVARLQGGDAWTHLFDDAGPLVAADHSAEKGHVSGQEVLVRVAETRGDEAA